VKANGHLAICDFGTSKTLRRTPTDGAPPAPASDDAARTRGLEALTKSIIGTPAYMAPEMLLEQPYSYSVDWWALGVTYAAAAAKSLARSPVRADLLRRRNCGRRARPLRRGKTERRYFTMLRARLPFDGGPRPRAEIQTPRCLREMHFWAPRRRGRGPEHVYV